MVESRQDHPGGAAVRMTEANRPWAVAGVHALVTVAATALVVLALVLVGPSSKQAFAILGLALLALTAFAASRWPAATLVLATLTTLLDPVVAPALAPPGVALDVIGISEPLLAAAGSVIFLGALRRGGIGQAVRDPTAILALGFIALSLASAVLNATPPVVASLGILMTIDAIAAFFVWRMLAGAPALAGRAAAGIVLAAVGVSLVGIGQVVLDPALLGFVSQEAYGSIRPITSILGNPNMVAMVLAFAAPFPVFGAVGLPERRHRWLSAAAAFLILLGLALTFSRGGWVAAGAGLAVGTILLDRRALILVATLVVLTWGAVTVMPVGLLTSGQATMPAASPNQEPDAAAPSQPPTPSPPTNEEDDPFERMTSNEVRLRLLRDGLRIVDDHLLLGVGPGRYGGAAATIVPSPVYAEYDTTLGRLRTVHNFWLHLTGEGGALGVAVFLAIVVALGIRFVLSARKASGSRFVVLAGCASAVTVVIVHNFTEMSLEGNVPGILIWLTLGIGSTLAHPSLRLAQHHRVDG